MMISLMVEFISYTKTAQKLIRRRNAPSTYTDNQHLKPSRKQINEILNLALSSLQASQECVNGDIYTEVLPFGSFGVSSAI